MRIDRPEAGWTPRTREAQTMGQSKIDLSNPNLQFFWTDTIDKVCDPDTGRMYSVFHADGGKREFVDGGSIERPNISYWNEWTREEFECYHPILFQK